ncbi:L,D-transpeptidase family protein [Marivibrio halodurans]|uniref:L,D-transpeptidase family protein n=1 Tax=Marivibrio halodurans TaxID=2039722 RepID=A0A8J7V1I9_9PROT|nr:L,D-transpeptidase family protein [Marivibrio halodurans]MBP5857836.1 L,D-transpeptidase family protein [Marivibrio halodurans]
MTPIPWGSLVKQLAHGLFPAVLLAISLIPAWSSNSAALDGDALSAALLRQVGEQGFAAPTSRDAAGRTRIQGELLEAYEARGWRSIWFAEGLAAGAGRLAAALSVLKDAGREGLNPTDYPHSISADRVIPFVEDAASDVERLAALEVESTTALLAYARDAAVGRAAPHDRDPNVFAEARTFEAAGFVARAFADATADPRAALLALHPGHPEYRGLRRALSLYRALAEKAEPPPIPEGGSLKPGMRDARVAAVRARLARFGDISVPEAEADLFTPALAIALRSFQRRHGLDTDAVAGKQTLAALNLPVSARVDQILLNMERWRWLPRELGPNYVLANIAGFEVTMVEEGSVVDRMAAVVGRPYRMSPVFSDAISYIELNPTWTVPPKIAREDLLAKIQADSAYLTDGGFQVLSGWGADARPVDPATVDWARVTQKTFSYKLRQGPGERNALGRVKVMFPNRFDIYLHDSPARDLYAKRVRTFSSGCIRLSRPFDLVNWLMRLTGGPDAAEIRTMLDTGETRVVKLPQRVPVHLIYATAWAGEDGQVHFRDDVYGRDSLLRGAFRN